METSNLESLRSSNVVKSKSTKVFNRLKFIISMSSLTQVKGLEEIIPTLGAFQLADSLSQEWNIPQEGFPEYLRKIPPLPLLLLSPNCFLPNSYHYFRFH